MFCSFVVPVVLVISETVFYTFRAPAQTPAGRTIRAPDLGATSF